MNIIVNTGLVINTKLLLLGDRKRGKDQFVVNEQINLGFIHTSIPKLCDQTNLFFNIIFSELSFPHFDHLMGCMCTLHRTYF